MTASRNLWALGAVLAFFVAAPFIGLLYVIAFPFVGATMLLWTLVRPKEKAPAGK